MLSQEQEEKAIREGVKRFLFVQTEKKKKETKKKREKRGFFFPQHSKSFCVQAKRTKRTKWLRTLREKQRAQKNISVLFLSLFFLNFFILLDVFLN